MKRPKSPAEIFPAALKRVRQAAGLTQAELAEKSGVSKVAIAAIEQAHRPNPQWATVLVLARALDCSLDEFAGGGSKVLTRRPKSA
jgi:transcriptional regulator with XRE-family HTH domain